MRKPRDYLPRRYAHAAMTTTPTVTVVTVAYGAEPWLERSVAAALASTDVQVDVVLVDNGCTDGAVEALRDRPGVTVVNDGTNTGFAEGCNIGARAATGTYLALVNPDALVEPDALARLVAVAARDDVGIATASVRLADRPHLLNAAGLELHFLGVSWAGRFEQPADDHDVERDVAGASGAAMVMRRDRWDALEGLCGEFFAYYEDCDLGVRVWQHGWRIVYVPTAVVVHRYEFSRNTGKFFLAERNRSVMVLTLWDTRTLALLAVPLLALEVAMLGLAIAQGWWREKLRAWWWLARHRGWIRRRRRHWQSARRVPDRVVAEHFETVLDPGNFPLPRAFAPLQIPLGWWWRAARRCL